MSKSDAAENDYVKFLFHGTPMPAYGSVLYAGLYVASPGESSDQTTNEISYTGASGNYARVAISRDAGGWTVVGNESENTSLIQFAASNTGPVTATHLGLGTSATGAGQLLVSEALAEPLVINNLTIPQFQIGGIQYLDN